MSKNRVSKPWGQQKSSSIKQKAKSSGSGSGCGDRIVFSEQYISGSVPGWNLGDVRITEAIVEFMEALESDFDYLSFLLATYFNGNYGEINKYPEDLKRVKEARAQGRSFSALYCVDDDEMVKIVTNPFFKQTTICLASED